MQPRLVKFSFPIIIVTLARASNPSSPPPDQPFILPTHPFVPFTFPPASVNVSLPASRQVFHLESGRCFDRSEGTHGTGGIFFRQNETPGPPSRVPSL